MKNSDKEVDRVKNIFKERYSVFKKIYDKALSEIKEGKIGRAQIKEMFFSLVYS